MQRRSRRAVTRLIQSQPKAQNGRYAAVLLQIGVWVLIAMFFGPRVKNVRTIHIICFGWAVTYVVNALTLTFLRPSATKDKIMLLMLVHVCVFSGYLTLSHCFIYSDPRHLEPIDLAPIPVDLRYNASRAAANSLVCFSEYSSSETMHWELLGFQIHRWGLAFSSVMSPLIPMTVGVVYYLMLADKLMPFNTDSAMWTADIIDCIVMFDTFFSHDAYFMFEDGSFDHLFVWSFVVMLLLWWNLVTWQAGQTHPVVSWCLNLSFVLLRGALRLRAMYCAPILVLKNLFFIVGIIYLFAPCSEDDEASFEACPSREATGSDATASNMKQLMEQLRRRDMMIANISENVRNADQRILSASKDLALKDPKELQLVIHTLRTMEVEREDQVSRLMSNDLVSSQKLKECQDVISVLRDTRKKITGLDFYIEELLKERGKIKNELQSTDKISL